MFVDTIKKYLFLGLTIVGFAASIAAGTWALSLKSQLEGMNKKLDSAAKALDGNKTALSNMTALLDAEKKKEPRMIERITESVRYIEKEAAADYARIDNFKREDKNETNCSSCYALLRSIVD